MTLRSVSPLLISLSIIFGGWLFLTEIIQVREIFLPSIPNTFKQLICMSTTGEFWLDVYSSFVRVFLGFLLSFIISYPLAIVSLIHKPTREVIFYIVEFFRYLPIPVFIPLTILWFGVDDLSKVMIVFLGTFAQMIPMYYDSARLMDDEKFNSFIHALKWKRWKYVKKVVIPGSAPHILDDSRLCFGWAWTYLIIAELLGAENGMGYAIIRAQRYLATDKIFVYIIAIGVLGVIMDRSLVIIRQRAFKWST